MSYPSNISSQIYHSPTNYNEPQTKKTQHCVSYTPRKSIIQINQINQNLRNEDVVKEKPNQNIFLNQYDDYEGFIFTNFIEFLKSYVSTLVDIDKEKSKYFECIALAEEIKRQIECRYSSNSHEFFLAAFQICTYLPSNYRNDTWDFLIRHQQNISLKISSPLIHSLHELTFVQKHSFKDLLSFLNILTFIYHGDKSLDQGISKDYICPVEMSLLKKINQNKKVIEVSLIHLKTISHSYTLKIPVNYYSALDTFVKHPSLGTFLDQIKPSLPKVICNIDAKQVLIHLLKEKYLTNHKVEHLAKSLMYILNNNFTNFGLRLIFAANLKNKKINFHFPNSFHMHRTKLEKLSCLELILKKITLLNFETRAVFNDIHNIEVILNNYLTALKNSNQTGDNDIFEFFINFTKSNSMLLKMKKV